MFVKKKESRLLVSRARKCVGLMQQQMDRTGAGGGREGRGEDKKIFQFPKLSPRATEKEKKCS